MSQFSGVPVRCRIVVRSGDMYETEFDAGPEDASIGMED